MKRISLLWRGGLLAFGLACGERLTATAAEEPAAFYLPKSPKAAEYMLSRLSNEQLIKAPRSEFVYVALLHRPGLDTRFRREALEELAKIRNTDQPAELIRALRELDAKGDSHAATVTNLTPLLLQLPRPALDKQREQLESLAGAESKSVRQAAWAALVQARGEVETIWKAVETDVSAQAEVVAAWPWLLEPKMRSSAFDLTRAAARRSDAGPVREAAIRALARFGERGAEAFEILAALFQSRVEPSVTLASLGAIPKKAWPKEPLAALLPALIAYFETVPAAQRSSAEHVEALQFASDLAGYLPADARKQAERVLRGLGVRVIVLRTLHEQMLYDKNQIVVEAGKPVEIVFENDDVMQHNLVVVAPGTLESVGQAAELMPPVPDAHGRLHVPDSPHVLHATRLLNPGEKERLRFRAPDEPGDYPYVCTYPGHWRRMTGVMKVVADLEAALATLPDPAVPVFTEWKLDDLRPALAAAAAANAAAGRGLFESLACAQCHKLGAGGYAFGPDLTGVFKRLNQDRAALLAEILEPSAKIEDRYRNVTFALRSGETVSGMVAAETDETVRVHAGPADALIMELRKADVQSRTPQDLSLMPAGLLNTLSKQQILDLLAYLEADGAAAPHAHSGH